MNLAEIKAKLSGLTVVSIFVAALAKSGITVTASSKQEEIEKAISDKITAVSAPVAAPAVPAATGPVASDIEKSLLAAAGITQSTTETAAQALSRYKANAEKVGVEFTLITGALAKSKITLPAVLEAAAVEKAIADAIQTHAATQLADAGLLMEKLPEQRGDSSVIAVSVEDFRSAQAKHPESDGDVLAKARAFEQFDQQHRSARAALQRQAARN